MVAPNRHMFCLACGEIIAQDQIANHMTANPSHALIRYHHNLPESPGDDPIGMIVSGALNGSACIHVDGSRTDTDTPESGTAAQPFRTIQDAVDYVVTSIAGPATLVIEPSTYLESVTMPDYIQIDARPGAVLRAPTGGNDALTITGTIGDPEPAFGATLIRGLQVVSDGDGSLDSWALVIAGEYSAPDVREPFVVLSNVSMDSYNEGNYVWNKGGAMFSLGSCSMGGDGTGGVGVKLKPSTSGLSCQCICDGANIGFGTNAIEAYEDSFFVGNDCRFFTNDGNPGTKIVVNMDATAGFSLVSIYSPNSMFGTPDKFVEAVGSGVGGAPTALVALYGGNNDLFDGFNGDLVDISDGVLFRMADGAMASGGGRGVVIDDAFMQCRNAKFRSGDGLALEVRGDDSSVQCVQSEFLGYSGGPASPVPGPCVLVDVLTDSVKIDGGLLTGAGTVVDVDRGTAWLIGGVDIDPDDVADVAYDVAAGAVLYRGHCNVRRGTRTVSGTENLLHSCFGEVEVGGAGQRARVTSMGTPYPSGGDGYEAGSLLVDPSGSTFRLHQNVGTEAAPVWKPISNGLMSGAGSPDGSVSGHAGLLYRDTSTDDIWVCAQDSSTIWLPAGSGGGGGGGLPTAVVDMSGGGAINVADSGKLLKAGNGDALVLPAPSSGLDYFVYCVGSGSQYLTLDAVTNGSTIYGPYQSAHGAWNVMRVYGDPSYVRVYAVEVAPATWAWFAWQGSGRIGNDTVPPGGDWYWSGEWAPVSHTHTCEEVVSVGESHALSWSVSPKNNWVYNNDGSGVDVKCTINTGGTFAAGEKFRLVNSSPSYEVGVGPDSGGQIILPDGDVVAYSGTPTDGLWTACGGFASIELEYVFPSGGTKRWLVRDMVGVWENRDTGKAYGCSQPLAALFACAKAEGVNGGAFPDTDDVWDSVGMSIEDFNDSCGMIELMSHPIVSCDHTTGTITIAGDWTTVYVPGRKFDILGSTANDNDGTHLTYMVASSSYSSPNTTITLQTSGSWAGSWATGLTDSSSDGSVYPGLIVVNKAGRYLIRASARAYKTAQAKLRVAQVPASATLQNGGAWEGYVQFVPANATPTLDGDFSSSSGTGNDAKFAGTAILDIDAGTWWEVQVWNDNCSAANNNRGTGGNAGTPEAYKAGGRNTFARLEIERVMVR